MSVPGANRGVIIRHRRRAREARIDDDELRLVGRLRLDHPFEAARMCFSGVATHDQNHVRVLDIDPMVRHRTTAKRRGKTRHRRTVSHASLVIEYEYA